MELVSLIEKVRAILNGAQEELSIGNEAQAKRDLWTISALILGEAINDIVAVESPDAEKDEAQESPQAEADDVADDKAITEEKPRTVGHCVPDETPSPDG